MKKSQITGLLAAACLFSSCEVPYQLVQSEPQGSTAGTGSPGPSVGLKPGATPTPTPLPVVCDPFNNGNGTSAKNGIKANLRYYESDPGIGWSMKTTDFDNGKPGVVSPASEIFLSKLDVPLRAWDTGFTVTNGDTLKTSNGSTLIEWFSLRMMSTFVAPTTADEGDYQFATISDDGSLLSVDLTGNGNYEPLVDNDWVHSQHQACALKTVHITKAKPLPFKLNYFQGPRVEIAMQLLWRKKPSAQTGLDCSGSGFEIVPAAAFQLAAGTTNPCAK